MNNHFIHYNKEDKVKDDFIIMDILQGNDLQKVEQLINKYGLYYRDITNYGILYYASYEVSKYLLEKYNKLINIHEMHGVEGKTAIFDEKDSRKVQFLIDKGLNVNHTCSLEENALFSAGNYDVAKVLIDNNINMSQRNYLSANFLFYISSLEIFQYALSKGMPQEYFNIKKHSGDNILTAYEFELYPYLIDEMKVDIHNVNNDGLNIILRIASDFLHKETTNKKLNKADKKVIEVIKYLLLKGVELDIPDKYGQNIKKYMSDDIYNECKAIELSIKEKKSLNKIKVVEQKTERKRI